MINFEQKIRSLVRDAYTKCAVIKARLANPNDFNRARRCAFDTDDEFTPCVKEVCIRCEHFRSDKESRHRMYDRHIQWCLFGCFIRCFSEGACKDCVYDDDVISAVREQEKERLKEA